MAKSGFVDPMELIRRRSDMRALAGFLRSFREGVDAAFADSDRAVPADPQDRPGVYARGNLRRMKLNRAFRVAAAKAGLVVENGMNIGGSWTWPVLRSGAYRIMLGVVDRPSATADRRLRCRGRYMREHVRRNGPIDPQKKLRLGSVGISTIVPNASIGAVIGIEGSLARPAAPVYVGFWIPSPNLTSTYFRTTVGKLAAYLESQVRAETGKLSATAVRKEPVLRKKPGERRQDGRS